MSNPMDQFKTRERANEGKRLPLYAPGGGKTDHWLQVRHVWSDAFQEANEAEVSGVREAMLAAAADDAKGNADEAKAAVDTAKQEAKLRIWSALVAAWSFPAPCTPDAVVDFLRDAPQIGEQIDKFAADSRRFFGNDSASSEAGSSQSAS